MIVEIIAKIVADIQIHPEDVCNSDSPGQYCSELHCNVLNDSGDYLSQHLGKDFEDIQILSATPVDIGVQEFTDKIDKWFPEYDRRMKE